MTMRISYTWFVVLFYTMILWNIVSLGSVTAAICELRFHDRNNLYDFNLASPSPKFPHGVLSEDGFYKVAVNETVLWFQLCDGMIFNHDPPRCFDCQDCGGPSHCGMGCSALLAKNIDDDKNPRMGVIVTTFSNSTRQGCSLSVSVICDKKGPKGPQTLEEIGTCSYATVLRHPAGCAKIVSINGGGLGWFGTLITIIFCLLGAYLLAGVVYRYFLLGIRGVDVIPNLDFWTSLPRRTQSSVESLWQRFRGPSSQGYQSSYSYKF
ncbi:Autophagy-related protein 27 [Dillenia turbinata]|uniref:Autophagy-related protein 27 n=1 Tax=Dillenia turbinata TaxID=194707 RepID=A0AAN8VDA3_9MAGN